MELDHVGPCIHGSVITKYGVPVANTQVRAYGGLATRWQIGQTITDADGHYQLCGLLGGSRIKSGRDEEWQLYIGVCVGDSGGQNPAAVSSLYSGHETLGRCVDLAFGCGLNCSGARTRSRPGRV
ncbi:MAG: hypothetical protein HQ519_05455 [Planctomycetes bacterium]|nr:hypothetical protein [Planctomycetota bacterium]